MAKQIDTFLGANTPFGFVSLFGELYDPYRPCRAYILKGGPGTGKSSLMKRVAAAALERGYDTECVHCGSDPQSLDAVLVPDLGLSVCDGTAPHVVEPKFPGACENLVNLGAFWNEKRLFAHSDEIRALTVENSLYHRRSTRYLSAAGALCRELHALTAPAVLEDKINGYALRFCSRELGRKKAAAPGTRRERYLSGYTPDGFLFFAQTVRTLCPRVIAVEDAYTPAASLLLENIGNRALGAGQDVIFCPDPLQPKARCAAVLLPTAGLALVRVGGGVQIPGETERTMHVTRFLGGDVLREHRQLLSFQTQMIDELTAQSVRMLRQAKQTHDRLEQLYIDAMDFDALNAFGDRFLQRLFA